MRVLLLRGEPCARARVHALALAAAHPKIELALGRQGAVGGEGVALQWQLGTHPARVLRVALAEFVPDVIHGYTDRLSVCARELTAGRIPVIHDMTSKDAEGRAIEESAALVVPSQKLLEEIAATHTLPPATCVFPSYPLADAEANNGRLVSLYQSLAREPLLGIGR
jgi:hypothetical protein